MELDNEKLVIGSVYRLFGILVRSSPEGVQASLLRTRSVEEAKAVGVPQRENTQREKGPVSARRLLLKAWSVWRELRRIKKLLYDPNKRRNGWLVRCSVLLPE